MARQTKVVVIDSEGRDKGKVFVVTELPARQAQRLATRAFIAMARAGIEIPEEISQLGVAGIIQIGIQTLARMSFEEADAISNELLACVQIRPSPSVTRPLIDHSTEGDDIEEVVTRFRLIKEVYELHTSFFFPGVPSP